MAVELAIFLRERVSSSRRKKIARIHGRQNRIKIEPREYRTEH